MTPYLCLLVFIELPSFPDYFLIICRVLCASLVFFVSSVLGLMFVLPVLFWRVPRRVFSVFCFASSLSRLL